MVTVSYTSFSSSQQIERSFPSFERAVLWARCAGVFRYARFIETQTDGSSAELNGNGIKHGREYVNQHTAGWRWCVWVNGKPYADGYASDRKDCDARIDSLCPI